MYLMGCRPPEPPTSDKPIWPESTRDYHVRKHGNLRGTLCAKTFPAGTMPTLDNRVLRECNRKDNYPHARDVVDRIAGAASGWGRLIVIPTAHYTYLYHLVKDLDKKTAKKVGAAETELIEDGHLTSGVRGF